MVEHENNNLIRLHEKRMEMAENRIDRVENDVKKIPWILLIVLVNILLTGIVLVFNIAKGLAH